MGVKRVRRAKLTKSPPSVSRLSKNMGPPSPHKPIGYITLLSHTNNGDRLGRCAMCPWDRVSYGRDSEGPTGQAGDVQWTGKPFHYVRAVFSTVPTTDRRWTSAEFRVQSAFDDEGE
jgi:hypothetical protein